MRQRNDTNYTQSVSRWPTDEFPGLTPIEVPPNGECDHPQLLAGFTAVEAQSAPVSKSAKKSAAQPAATEQGGEPA